ncbi:MAG: transketolase, partial [Mesorhizobium sp.]
MLTNQSPPPPASFELLRERAHQLRRNMLVQARGKGQGYVGQALGTAEFLSALYFNEMRYDAARMDDPDRDRFLMSTGHYALSLWAVFAEIGLISRDVLPLYGKDAGPIDMTTFDAVLG